MKQISITNAKPGLVSSKLGNVAPEALLRANNIAVDTGVARTREGAPPWTTRRMQSVIFPATADVITSFNSPVASVYEYETGTARYKLGKVFGQVWLTIPHALTLASAAAVGATSLVVDQDISLLPSTGYVRLENLVLAYTGLTTGTKTITLAAALTRAFASGAAVECNDPRPLHATAFSTDANHRYLSSGYTEWSTGTNEVERMSCTQVGSYLYYAFNDLDTLENSAADRANYHKLWRWDGFIYTKGRVACTGNATVTAEAGLGTGFVAAGVRKGDTIFFYDHSHGYWLSGTTFATAGRTIAIVAAGALTLDGNGIDTTELGVAGGNYCDFIIVRIHRAGLPEGTTTTNAVKTDTGSLTQGVYSYCWRYVNSQTSYTGSVSTQSTAQFVDRVKTASVLSLSNVAWIRNLTVFGSKLYTAANGVIYSSTDGIDWVFEFDTGAASVRCMAADNFFLYYAVGGSNIVYSYDGYTYNLYNQFSDEVSVSSLLTWNGQLYVGTRSATNGGRIYTNPSGEWTTPYTVPTAGVTSIDCFCHSYYNGDRIIAGSNDEGILYSSGDAGATWTATADHGEHGTWSLHSSVIGPGTYGTIYAGTHYAGKIMSSVDGGTTWALAYTFPGSTGYVSAITETATGLVAVGGYSTALMLSTNGTTWTSLDTMTGVTGAWSLAVFGGYLYIGSGTPGQVLRYNPTPVLKLRVSGWLNPPTELDVDGVEIFRSKSAGLYYSLTTVSLPAANAYYDDDGSATITTTQLEADAAYHTRPPTLSSLTYFNNRLYGRVQEEGHVLAVSTYNAPEYFPDVQVGATDPESVDIWMGARFMIGAHSKDAILAISPDSGAYTSTGYTGDSLLLLMRNRGVRFYGTNWSDFAFGHAFNTGIVADLSVASGDGFTYWLSDQGVVTCPMGSNAPQVISGAIWPTHEIQDAIKLVNHPNHLLPWTGAFWNGKYVLSGFQGTTGHNDCVFVFNGNGGPVDVINHAVYGLAVDNEKNLFAGTALGQRIDRLETSIPQTNTNGDGTNWGNYTYVATPAATALGYALGAVPVEAITGKVYAGDLTKAGGLTKTGILKNLLVCVAGTWPDAASSDQSFTLNVYANGDTTTAKITKTATVTGSSSADSNAEQRCFLYFTNIDTYGNFFNFGLSGNLTRQLRWEWMVAEIEESTELKQSSFVVV